MADSASTSNRTISDAVAMLRPLGISVDFTDQPIDLTNSRTDESGRVLATVGLLTVTATGRVFVELYDAGDNVRRTMLEHLADDTENAIREGRNAVYLSCWLHPDTVLEMREWAELRDSLQAVA